VSVLTRYPKKLSVEFENFHAIYSVTYKAIPFKYYFCNSALSSIRLSKKLLYLLKTEDFDIVHAQNWISAYSVMRAKQKMKKFPPSVLTIRDYSYVCPLNDAICLCNNNINNIKCYLFKMMKCQLHRLQKEVSNKNNIFKTLGLIPYCTFHYMDYILLKRSIHNFDTYITCSDFVRYVVLNNLKISPNKVHTVYNAIDMKDFKTVHCFKNKEKSNKTILYVGRLSYEKGLIPFINAIPLVVKENQNCHFLVVGDSPIRVELEYYAKKVGVQEYITFEGFVPYDQINKYYQISDIVVVPSIWYEPFGRTSIEAMASGRPVVASNIGGISEVIEHEKTGLLVEPNNSEELANAIIILLNDKEMRMEMSKHAYKVAKEKYNANIIAKKVLKVYKNVL